LNKNRYSNLTYCRDQADICIESIVQYCIVILYHVYGDNTSMMIYYHDYHDDDDDDDRNDDNDDDNV